MTTQLSEELHTGTCLKRRSSRSSAIQPMPACCTACLARRVSCNVSWRYGVLAAYLGWPLKPLENYEYIRSLIQSLIKAIRENIQYPRGLPSYLSSLPEFGQKLPAPTKFCKEALAVGSLRCHWLGHRNT